MNPRQRRGVLLLTVAAAGMVIAFVSLSSYVKSVRSEVGPLEPVLRLVSDVQPYQPVPPDAVEEVMVPGRWLPPAAMRSKSELTGLVAIMPLYGGSYLQRGMVGPPPSLKPGEREVTLTLAANSVPAEIRRASTVDVIATFRGATEPASSKIIVNDGLVLDRAPAGRERELVRLTLALSAPDSLAISHAESLAAALRVVLVAPGSAPLPPEGRTFAEPSAQPAPAQPTPPKGRP